MNRRDALKILWTTATGLAAALGSHFHSFIAYGSVLQNHFSLEESNLNGALIVSDDTDINRIRTAFAPLWSAHRNQLRRPPLVMTMTSFARTCRQFPLLAAHWRDTGRQMAGQIPLPSIAAARPEAEQAFFADQLFLTSSLLAPAILSAERRQAAERAEQRLRRRFRIDVEGKNGSVDGRLAALIRLLDINGEMPTLPEDEPPFNIPGLVSIYESLGDVYFILARGDDLLLADWEEIGADLEARGFSSVRVGTAAQFTLTLKNRYPLDVKLLGYQLTWGNDLLQDLSLPVADILDHAGRVAARLEIDQYPAAVLTTPDEDEADRRLIHDYQNKLLNIRLQNELLSRLQLSEFGRPPAVPDRHNPHPVRLQAIWQQFRWWSDFYDRAVRAIRFPS